MSNYCRAKVLTMVDTGTARELFIHVLVKHLRHNYLRASLKRSIYAHPYTYATNANVRNVRNVRNNCFVTCVRTLRYLRMRTGVRTYAVLEAPHYYKFQNMHTNLSLLSYFGKFIR